MEQGSFMPSTILLWGHNNLFLFSMLFVSQVHAGSTIILTNTPMPFSIQSALPEFLILSTKICTVQI